MDTASILAHLQTLSNPTNQEGMKHFAVGDATSLGIPIPVLRDLAKSIKKNHALALDLWESGIHEARLLATMIDDPKQVSEKQMDTWTSQFNSWDICDQCCGNLFRKTPFYLNKAIEYSHAKEEFIKRTGFTLMVQYAVHDKKGSDDVCIPFLQRIDEEAYDDRNFVKKAVNWCLRQIGKRSAYLHPLAIDTARRIDKQTHRSAHWIAKDALRELESEAVKKRLGIIE